MVMGGWVRHMRNEGSFILWVQRLLLQIVLRMVQVRTGGLHGSHNRA